MAPALLGLALYSPKVLTKCSSSSHHFSSSDFRTNNFVSLRPNFCQFPPNTSQVRVWYFIISFLLHHFCLNSCLCCILLSGLLSIVLASYLACFIFPNDLPHVYFINVCLKVRTFMTPWESIHSSCFLTYFHSSLF